MKKKYFTLKIKRIKGWETYPLLNSEQVGMIVQTLSVGKLNVRLTIVELTDEEYQAEKVKFDEGES